MKLNDYQHWMFNHLRRNGYTVVVIDPNKHLIQGSPDDKPILDEVLQREKETEK